MKLSLIVPCYNEQDNVDKLLEACNNAFLNRIEDFEIVFVNDGSIDDTRNRLRAIFADNNNIKVINLSRNFGKDSAIYAGLSHACGDYVSIIDADLQQSPEIVVEMVDFLDKNPDYDCIAAYQDKRIEGKTMSFMKKLFYKLINHVCEIPFKSGASDFRTFRKAMADSILLLKEYHRFSKGIFSWVGFNTYYMPYRVQERHAGKTAWNFRKLLKYAWNGFVSFTTFPLKLATIMGGICAFCALVYTVVVIIQKLCFGINVPGFPTIVVLILLIGGLQLITLGIIGEYIAHIYIEGKHRPIYIIKEYLTYDEVSEK